MKNGIILFDLDRTLFDTDKSSSLRLNIITKILNTNDIEKINKVKDEYRKTLNNERDYEPDDFVRLLAKEFMFDDVNSLLDVYYGLDNKHVYSESVYPEVVDVLTKLKDKYRLGVFSEGTEKFQNYKFNSSGITEYFDKDLIFIKQAKDTKEKIEQLPDGKNVVDDKESICTFLFEKGIKPIWLNKKDDKKSDKFITIHNLLELIVKLV